MSYNNFKRTVWSKHIQHELGKITTFKNDCDFKFEGEVKKGEKVKILGVSRPTIKDYDGTPIGAPEVVADSSVFLEINQSKSFNFAVDDVDKAQSVEGLMSSLMEESSIALAEDEDTFIATDLAKNSGGVSTSLAITTKDNAKAAVDAAFVYLWKNGVRFKDKVTMYLSPEFYTLFKDYIMELKTKNDELVARGILGLYNNASVKLTNNLYNDNTDDHIIIKTSRAYAFCDAINSVEAYRPEELFADAVKGLHVYGGKMVRPKESYCIKAHYK